MKKTKLKVDEFSAVLVEWTDSVSDGAAWRDYDDTVDWSGQPMKISSIGWLVEVSKTHYTLASAYSHLTEQLGGLWKIPKGCVLKVTYL